MINDKNKALTFLTIEEQIDRLENNRKLIINNKKQLKHYLETHNYEFFINEYSKFLLKLGDSSKKFVNGINDKMLISIFEFDREISYILFKYLSEIERKIKTQIAYSIPLIHKEIANGDVLNLNHDDFKKIFSNVDVEEFKIKLKKHCPKEILEQCSHPSLWKLAIYWSFGTIKSIYDSLNQQVQQKIIDSFGLKYKISIKEFGDIIFILNKARNRICHNNQLLYFENKLKTYKNRVQSPIGNFLHKNKLVEKYPNRIRLFHIIKTIDVLFSGSSDLMENINNSLINLKNDIINSVSNKDFGLDIYNKIIKFMRFE